MAFDYCVYHRKCIDGISSAWIVKNYFPNITLIECAAGENLSENIELESLYQKNVIFVDVCPPTNDEIIALSKLAKEILIIDHHITTYESLQQIDNINNLKLIFDDTKSGCQLTWEHFCKHEEIPWFLNYIADRDLWKTTVPYSKEINTALYEEGHTKSFENLDKLYNLASKPVELEEFKEKLIKKGKILVENRNMLIMQSVRTALRCRYKDYNIWVYTCPRHIISDVGSKLVRWRFKDSAYPDFVMTWNYDLEGHYFGLSFRSAKNTVDVHTIARELSEKGGGHRNAAGCVLKGGTELRSIFIPVEEEDAHKK
jgi:oligoribonuclease NrnB/cAMP/cGMP phosphodiesterase (DHH superfamily)